MLNRRDILAASITMAAGTALTEPVARWLDTAPGGLPARDHGPGRVGMSAVEEIERTIRFFKTNEAAVGGGLAREAAVGQLKYAVDLAQQSSYSEAVGTELLTVIAGLASQVAWMSHDVGMDGPAQRYAWLGLRAAHEAGTERTRLRAVGLLCQLAELAREAGHYQTAHRLHSLALDRIPSDPGRFNPVRAMVWGRLARVLSGMGSAHLGEVDRYVTTSFALHHKAEDDEPTPWLADYFWYSCGPYADAELASDVASSYLALARVDPSFAARAQQRAQQARDRWGEGYVRSRVFDQITLARTGFRAGELDQACHDGQEAVRMAAPVSDSHRVRTRLTQLMDDATAHQREPAVRELREQLRAAVTEG